MRGRGIGRGRRGLVGTMATTAVIAGTATAVSSGMRNHSNNKAQEEADAQNQQYQYEQMQAQQAAQQAAVSQQAAVDQAVAQALAAQQAAAPAPAPAAPAAGGDDLISKLKELASLRDAGILGEEEFSAAKAKLLAG